MIINKFRKTRNNFKHYGIRPSRGDIEECNTIVKLFFEENTEKVFGLKFSEISLANAIKDDKIREHIKRAEEHLKLDDLNIKSKINSMKNIKRAYEIIQNKYINKIKENIDLNINSDLSSIGLENNLIKKYPDLAGIFNKIDSNFDNIVYWVNNNISEVLSIFMLNIDPY